MISFSLTVSISSPWSPFSRRFSLSLKISLVSILGERERPKIWPWALNYYFVVSLSVRITRYLSPFIYLSHCFTFSLVLCRHWSALSRHLIFYLPISQPLSRCLYLLRQYCFFPRCRASFVAFTGLPVFSAEAPQLKIKWRTLNLGFRPSVGGRVVLLSGRIRGCHWVGNLCILYILSWEFVHWFCACS